MLRGNTLGVVVANRHHEELAELNAEDSHIFFAKQAYAAGLLEAIEYYHFFQTCEWVV
jgi:sucrose-phosphate synthase